MVKQSDKEKESTGKAESQERKKKPEKKEENEEKTSKQDMSPGRDKSKEVHHKELDYKKSETGSEKGGSELKDMPLDQLMKKLDTSEKGLSQDEAKKRIERYGYNELTEEKESPILQFLSYFRGTIPYMILAAAIISAILGHYPTLIIIMVLLFLNAVIGFREERQAGNAIAALKEKLAVKANVKREDKWSSINASELVPGDIVYLDKKL